MLFIFSDSRFVLGSLIVLVVINSVQSLTAIKGKLPHFPSQKSYRSHRHQSMSLYSWHELAPAVTSSHILAQSEVDSLLSTLFVPIVGTVVVAVTAIALITPKWINTDDDEGVIKPPTKLTTISQDYGFWTLISSIFSGDETDSATDHSHATLHETETETVHPLIEEVKVRTDLQTLNEVHRETVTPTSEKLVEASSSSSSAGKHAAMKAKAAEEALAQKILKIDLKEEELNRLENKLKSDREAFQRDSESLEYIRKVTMESRDLVEVKWRELYVAKKDVNERMRKASMMKLQLQEEVKLFGDYLKLTASALLQAEDFAKNVSDEVTIMTNNSEHLVTLINKVDEEVTRLIKWQADAASQLKEARQLLEKDRANLNVLADQLEIQRAEMNAKAEELSKTIDARLEDATAIEKAANQKLLEADLRYQEAENRFKEAENRLNEAESRFKEAETLLEAAKNASPTKTVTAKKATKEDEDRESAGDDLYFLESASIVSKPLLRWC